jgi:hypothetical protein
MAVSIILNARIEPYETNKTRDRDSAGSLTPLFSRFAEGYCIKRTAPARKLDWESKQWPGKKRPSGSTLSARSEGANAVKESR